MKWCVYCEKMVYPQKQFSFLAFLLTIWGLGFPYLIYYLFFKRAQCPSCGGKSFKPHAPHVTSQ